MFPFQFSGGEIEKASKQMRVPGASKMERSGEDVSKKEEVRRASFSSHSFPYFPFFCTRSKFCLLHMQRDLKMNVC